MATITKRQIAERIAKRTGQTQVITKEIVQQFIDEIVDELGKGNKLEFRDFGIFEVVKRRSRTGRNPRTGEKVFVPAKKVVSFKMGRTMAREVRADHQSVARQAIMLRMRHDRLDIGDGLDTAAKGSDILPVHSETRNGLDRVRPDR